MRSPGARLVLVALAMGLGVLGWSAGSSAEDRYASSEPYEQRYLSSEHYEGYGPIDESIRVNNPLIPEPIGPKWMRDFIPGVADEMRTWPAVFRDLELNLHLRSYYFNRDIPLRPRPPTGPDSVTQEAWALGGWAELKSGWLLDMFRVGTAGYTSQPAYAPDTRDGTGLLAPGQQSIVVLGQAYAQFRYEHYVLLTGYRQLVDQGFVNPQDNRMIPNTFEGATVTGTVGPVEYYLGYLTAMKRRNLDTFDNMALVAGVTTGQNRGMVLTTLNFAPAEGVLAPLRGLQVYLGNYLVPDVFNTVFVNPEYRHALTEDWRLRFGVQYWDQQSVGSQLVGSFSTWNVAALGEVGWRGLSFLAMMSATGPGSGILTPYGGWSGYVSLVETDFNLANEKAWEVGFTYDWGGTTFPAFRVPGLWTSLLFAQGRDVKSVNGIPVATRNELDLFAVWRPPPVPGFQFRFLASHIKETDKQRSFYDFRIIMDFEIPLF